MYAPRPMGTHSTTDQCEWDGRWDAGRQLLPHTDGSSYHTWNRVPRLSIRFDLRQAVAIRGWFGCIHTDDTYDILAAVIILL